MEKKAIPNFEVFDIFDKLPLQGEPKRGIEAMDRMDEIQHLDSLHADVKKCGHCEWCLINKRLSGPKKFIFDPKSLEF